jgi:hypothetical protein
MDLALAKFNLVRVLLHLPIRSILLRVVFIETATFQRMATDFSGLGGCSYESYFKFWEGGRYLYEIMTYR